MKAKVIIHFFFLQINDSYKSLKMNTTGFLYSEGAQMDTEINGGIPSADETSG